MSHGRKTSVRLTDAEKDALVFAANSRLVSLVAAVERIVTDRLAPVEALAAKWDSTPDHPPTAYDQGRVDQRHAMTADLLDVLTPTSPTESEGAE